MRFIMIFTLLFFAYNLAADDVASVKPFQLMAVALAEGGAAIARCNTQTGEGFYTLGDKWVKGNDSGELPPSTYLCSAVPFRDKGWRFVRMDETSGETWILQGEHWKKILP